MSTPNKGMTASEIRSRVKKSGSYINLKPNQIVAIVLQLSPGEQKECFNDAKKLLPLDKVSTAGIVAIHGLNKDKPISKIPVAERRKLIRNAIGKNAELTKFLNENNLTEQAGLLQEKELPGDFKPSGIWKLIDGLLDELDLSNPDNKDK